MFFVPSICLYNISTTVSDALVTTHYNRYPVKSNKLNICNPVNVDIYSQLL